MLISGPSMPNSDKHETSQKALAQAYCWQTNHQPPPTDNNETNLGAALSSAESKKFLNRNMQ